MYYYCLLHYLFRGNKFCEYVFSQNKGLNFYSDKPYTIIGKSYIIHTFLCLWAVEVPNYKPECLLQFAVSV